MKPPSESIKTGGIGKSDFTVSLQQISCAAVWLALTILWGIFCEMFCLLSARLIYSMKPSQLQMLSNVIYDTIIRPISAVCLRQLSFAHHHHSWHVPVWVCCATWYEKSPDTRLWASTTASRNACFQNSRSVKSMEMLCSVWTIA